MTLSPIIEHFAVATGALTGLLAARGKQLDLFGVLVLAVVTAFGGGTVRDLLVGDTPVVWLRSPGFLHTAVITGTVAFFVCRFWQPPAIVLKIADACALALFTIVGAHKGLALDLATSVVILLGIVTGVAGGILRDVLLGQMPLVFQRNTYLYATAAGAGAAGYAILMRKAGWSADHAELCGIAMCLLLRLGALRWRLALPGFDKGSR